MVAASISHGNAERPCPKTGMTDTYNQTFAVDTRLLYGLLYPNRGNVALWSPQFPDCGMVLFAGIEPKTINPAMRVVDISNNSDW